MNRYIRSYFLVLCSAILIISCSKEYSIETDKGLAAHGSLKDNSGNCLPSQVSGSYAAGVATGSSNYIMLRVNVTVPGTYRISTTTQNGFSFADTGTFNNVGLDTVMLKASGTPLAQGPTNFTVSFDSTSCPITVNVGENSPNVSDTAWSFSEGSKRFNGYIDSAYVDDTTVGVRALILVGPTAATSDSVFLAVIALPPTGIPTGTYTTTSSALYYFYNHNNSSDIYSADQTTSGATITYTISSYNTTTRIVQGTFTGTAHTASGGTVQITNGRFRAKVS